MTRHRSALRAIVGATLAAVVAACGGDSFDSSQTVVSGLIVLPSSDSCRDCGNQRATVQVRVLFEGRPPETIATVSTNELGVYKTGDLTAALDETSGSADTNGNGQRAFIVVASVNESGALIGGVLSATTGAAASKDFNPTTHIACVAAVFLTAGTDPATPLDCAVRPVCDSSEPRCLTTIDPDTLSRERINNLEGAAATISAQVAFPEQVASAACAVLTCTEGGVRPAEGDCVSTLFAGREPR